MSPPPNMFMLANCCVRRSGSFWFVWFPAKARSRVNAQRWVIAARNAPTWV